MPLVPRRVPPSLWWRARAWGMPCCATPRVERCEVRDWQRCIVAPVARIDMTECGKGV